MFNRLYNYLFGYSTVEYTNLEDVPIDNSDEADDLIEADPITTTLRVDELENIKKYHYYKGVRRGILVTGIVFTIIFIVIISVFAIIYK